MERTTPSKIEGFKDVYEVSCGVMHTMFLVKKPDDTGGFLYGLGLGTRGRLGVRPWEANHWPKSEIPDESAGEGIEDAWFVEKQPARIVFKKYPSAHVRILRVQCGGDHTICLDTTGKLYSFGMNFSGQLGLGHFDDVKDPTKIDFGMPDDEVEIAHFACGARHSLVAMVDGSLWTFGNNENNRLGHPDVAKQAFPLCVQSIMGTNVCFVAGGESHSGAVDKNGHVWMWGAGTYGRLGLGDEIDIPIPRRIETLTQVVISQIALGGFHSLFLSEKPQERLFATGAGCAVGLISENDHACITNPKQILEPDVLDAANPILQIAAGMFHSMALQTRGTLAVWGIGTNGRLGTGKMKNEPYPHSLKSGHFGFSTKTDKGEFIAKLVDPSDSKRKKKEETDELADGANQPWTIKTIACGATSSAILTYGGSVYVWGSNEHKQLGTGTQADLWHPKLLHLPHRRAAKELALGAYHCLLVTNTMELFSWGRGAQGQLGSGRAVDQPLPAKVMTNGAVLGCGAGDEHSAIIVKGIGHPSNQLYTMGSCESGKLGLGSNFTSGQQLQPMLVPKIEMPKRPKTDDEEKNLEAEQRKAIQDRSPGVVKVRCASYHTVVIVNFTTHISVCSFGGGWYGRLGLGDQQNVYEPVIVKMECQDTVDVAAGSFHTAAIGKGGDLWLWGRDRAICEPENGLTPKRFIHIDGLPKVLNVACGELHSLAVVEGGEVWVWGDNTNRQLGLGRVTRNDEFLPVQARAFPGAVDLLATGPSHSIGLCNGDVYGWGNQSCGRLGLQSRNDSKYVVAPTKTKPEWASIEAMSGAVQGGEAGDGEEEEDEAGEEEQEGGETKGNDKTSQEQMANMLTAIRDGQKVQQFHTMQTLIQQEQEDAKEKTLKKREEELVTELTKFLEEIYKLPEREARLTALESNLEQSISGNLKYFSHLLIPDVATLTTNQKVLATFGYYEELVWVLQQQGCYLAQLSMCLEDDAEKRKIFYRVVDNIYQELDDSRTLNLFLAMLKLMINKEIEHAKKPSELFHWESSRVFYVFQKFALKALHFKDVVHPLMDSTIDGKDGREASFFARIKIASERNEVFALTREEYIAGQEGGEGKDQQELTAEFNANLEKFKDFMTSDFTSSIKANHLADNLRKILAHSMTEIQRRQFTLDGTGLNVPPELKICEPLMFLHVMGILLPIFRDPKTYAGKHVLLAKCASDSTHAGIVTNLKRVMEFLSRMMYEVDTPQGFSKKDHQLLISIAKNIKPVLLRYVKDEAVFIDNTDTQLTIDMYVSHFDRRKHFVSLQTSDLLKLSNMLKVYENKLRLTEKDKVEELVQKIGNWDDNMIQAAEKNEKLHNFVVSSRFLFHTKAMVICKTSHCPVPPILSAGGGAGGSEGVEVVTRYIPEDSNDPRRVLEELFRDLPEIHVQNFAEMQEEFTKLMKRYSSANPPDFDMTNRLSTGLEKLQELQTVEAHAEDVLQFMSDGLTARDKHRQYLREVLEGKVVIAEAQKQYNKELELAAQQLAAMTRFSMDLQLPEKFVEQSAAHSSSLKFNEVNARIRKLRSFDPAAMPEGCSYSPSAQYMFTKLQKDKCFVSCDAVAKEMLKKLQFTFRCTANGGVDVIVNIVQGKALNQVSRFKITADDVQAMKRMEKGIETTIGDGFGPGGGPFAVVIANKLTELLTALSK